MIKLNAIPLDYEPRKKILPKLPKYPKEPEMSEFESAFLCGTIKQFRPKKILEVGIAGGATTAIILQALEDIGEPYEMHSVDINTQFYRDKTKPSGFMAAFAKENNLFTPPISLNGKHEFRLGRYLPQVIDEIGGDIDFVILDTVHTMPGEGLDFLSVLPYLKEKALVVLHDVSLNQLRCHMPYSNANAVLFSAVTAEKFLNRPFDDTSKIDYLLNVHCNDANQFGYPNIAAFRVNEQTLENIENVFLTLILRWHYFPINEHLVAYRNLYQRFYSADLCEIFQEAIDMNAYNFYLAQHK